MKVNRPPSPEFRRVLALAHRDPDAPQPKCAGKPELYVDYDVPPSAEGAQRLCSGCPLLDPCAKSAAYSRPSWGIHAGSAWDRGRRYRDTDENYPDNS